VKPLYKLLKGEPGLWARCQLQHQSGVQPIYIFAHRSNICCRWERLERWAKIQTNALCKDQSQPSLALRNYITKSFQLEPRYSERCLLLERSNRKRLDWAASPCIFRHNKGTSNKGSLHTWYSLVFEQTSYKIGYTFEWYISMAIYCDI